jgi:hypothetical protein
MMRLDGATHSSSPDLFRPSTSLLCREDVDTRDKRGHDDSVKSRSASSAVVNDRGSDCQS